MYREPTGSVAEELITRGWYQGALEGPDGSVCIAGALCASIYGTPQFGQAVLGEKSELYCKLAWRASELLDFRAFGPWNDDPNRTYDEVLRIAKQLDEEFS